jgi:hypothetical protein
MVTGRSSAGPFWLDMQESEELRLLYFDPLTTYLTPHVTRSYYNSLQFQKRIFNWTPYEKTTVTLRDYQDYGNASALSSPFGIISVHVAPLYHTFESFPAVERVYMLMNHELVHVATGDVANSQDLRWRRFFGGKPVPVDDHPESLLYAYLTAPRNIAPRWYFEGSAVFMETWMSGGYGRAQGGYDEMKFRALVRDGEPFYDNLGLASEGTVADFQTTTNAYFYGTRFMSYLAYVYSPEQVIEWLKREEDSKRYYADQFEFVFGKSLEAAWHDWIAFETEFQRKNLESIHEEPVTPAQPLSKTALGSVSRAYVDPATHSLIGGFYYLGVLGHIGMLSLDDGSTRRLVDIKVPMKYKVTALAFDPSERVLFFTTDNNRYRDLKTLDIDSGQERMLIVDARIGDLAFNRSDKTLWGIRNQNGYVGLVRLRPPYTDWELLYALPYGQVMADIDISPDGRLLSATMEEINGNQYLRLFRTEDLLDGYMKPISEFDFGRAVPEGFVFSPDGKYLFGSSFYTGVSNIFRYEVATSEIEAVSNAETGFFLPIPQEDGTLIVFEYTGEGFLPGRIDPVPLEDLSAITFLGNEIAKKHPVVMEWGVGSPARIDLEAVNARTGEYWPRREIQYAGGYPVIEGYRDTFALGWSAQLEDPMAYNSLRADLSYSVDTYAGMSDSERLHADLEYKMLFWRFRYWHNDADFYDLFGPTERARKGDALIAEYDYPIIFDGPRTLYGGWEAAYYTGLDTLPGNQNVASQFTDLLSVYGKLEYSHTQESLGAVDHEKGLEWDVFGYLDHANSDIVPRLKAGLNFGFVLPIRHSSVWLYNSAGVADGDRGNTLANWYFGAFGNNYVDDGEVKRYRKYYSFPGFEIDELSAQTFAKSLLEWNLPPLRFAKVGIPSLFLNSARPALFAGVLFADPGDSQFSETYYNLGFQVDLDITVAHWQSMTLSFGYAKGWSRNDSGPDDNELMVSLKVF